MNYRTPVCVLATALLFLLPLNAQDKKEGTTNGDPPPPPINLKVLKVSTRPEVEQIMRTFAGGLGVQCNYCHMQENFASDDNPKKEVARRMIRMIQKINAEFPDGKMHVSCYTCHRGETEPKTAPAQ
jgi:hypothetical protein